MLPVVFFLSICYNERMQIVRKLWELFKYAVRVEKRFCFTAER